MATREARRGPGRPPGRTEQGARTRKKLYDTAVQLFGSQGYAQTTLRGIGAAAGVSPALTYKYFPAKSALVLELYETLSARYAAEAASMPTGRWFERAFHALETSLSVLAPHRPVLADLVPVLVGDPEFGLFSQRTAFSRERVQGVFIDAVSASKDTMQPRDAEALGRLLYVVHLAVILWWLLDKTPAQTATRALVSLMRRMARGTALALRFPRSRSLVRQVDELIRQALFGEGAARATSSAGE